MEARYTQLTVGQSNVAALIILDAKFQSQISRRVHMRQRHIGIRDREGNCNTIHFLVKMQARVLETVCLCASIYVSLCIWDGHMVDPTKCFFSALSIRIVLVQLTGSDQSSKIVDISDPKNCASEKRYSVLV